MTSTTPPELTITPRNLKFNRAAKGTRWWNGGDPVATAFFNALSATFPQGEAFFIETVRRYRDQADGPLKEQISAFVQQEVLHTREHVVFNKLIEDAGYDTKAMDDYTRHRLTIARSRHPVAQLAMTVALEHFTAMMANALLNDPKHLQDAPEDIQKLWQWHAIEEIEHKAVAFDTYVAATRSVSAWRRWNVRARVMLFVSFLFWRSTFRHMRDFFQQDGINTVSTWLKVARYLLVKPGIMRQLFLPYLSFYRPSFHPWIHDDRALIKQAEQYLNATA